MVLHRPIESTPLIGHVDYFRVARSPSWIDAKHEDHFLQADLSTPVLISSLSGTADCCGLSFFDNLPSDGLYSRGTHTREHREGVRDWLD